MILVYIIISVIVSIFAVYFIWKHRYIKALREKRDSFDLTTPEGRFLIRIYNDKIDQLNGYKVFKK